MKKILGFATLALLFLVFQSAALAATIIPDSQLISAFDLESSLSGKALIDVRIDEDIWEHGIIEGSTAISLHSLIGSDKLPAKKDAAIVVISQDGVAGELAVLGLGKLGYTDVKSLDGGIAAWKMMGMAVKEVPRPANKPVAGGC
jgi:rhodanese-related sulfurtransferase